MSNNKRNEIIYHFIVQIVAIISLTLYGIVLAREGIDHTVALILGIIIGAIAGVKIKALSRLLL